MKREVTVDRVVQASFPAAEGLVEGIVRQIDGARCLVEWDHGVSEWYSLRAVSAMKEPAMSPQQRRPARRNPPTEFCTAALSAAQARSEGALLRLVACSYVPPRNELATLTRRCKVFSVRCG